MNRALRVLIFLPTIGLATNAGAQQQVGFNPQGGGTHIVSRSTVVSYETELYIPGMHTVKMQAPPGVVVVPDSFEIHGTASIYITVTDSAGFCSPPDALWGVGAITDVGSYWYGYSVIFYDPHVIGHPSVFQHGFYQNTETDTLNFGSIRVDDTALLQFTIADPDSFPAYRKFKALEVVSPFKILDTIPLSYPCINGNGRPIAVYAGVSYHPTTIGHFIDTVHLLDPLTNDSIPLILIGNAYDASVADDASAPQFRMFPNPCDRTLNIWLTGDEFSAVEIWNVMGERVYSSRAVNSELAVDCSALPAGVYFAEVRTKDRIIRQRLIVAH